MIVNYIIASVCVISAIGVGWGIASTYDNIKQLRKDMSTLLDVLQELLKIEQDSTDATIQLIKHVREIDKEWTRR